METPPLKKRYIAMVTGESERVQLSVVAIPTVPETSLILTPNTGTRQRGRNNIISIIRTLYYYNSPCTLTLYIAIILDTADFSSHGNHTIVLSLTFSQSVKGQSGVITDRCPLCVQPLEADGGEIITTVVAAGEGQRSTSNGCGFTRSDGDIKGNII